ncbi:MAG TPA: hypothetical protein VGS61_02120 [Acidimicrobiales bacterium]|nr:hypothetical protein [Acidimicrobiales bacterium]
MILRSLARWGTRLSLARAWRQRSRAWLGIAAGALVLARLARRRERRAPGSG